MGWASRCGRSEEGSDGEDDEESDSSMDDVQANRVMVFFLAQAK